MGGGFPQIGVGAVVWRGDEVLLVKRAKPPRDGEWSLPAGKQEAGETLHEAVRREVREETGLEIDILGLIDVVDAIFRDEAGALTFHYTIIDYSARWRGGEASAASDVSAVRWVRLSDLEGLGLWDETHDMILKSARRHGPLAREEQT